MRENLFLLLLLLLLLLITLQVVTPARQPGPHRQAVERVRPLASTLILRIKYCAHTGTVLNPRRFAATLFVSFATRHTLSRR